jgi:acetyl esterase/lipase
MPACPRFLATCLLMLWSCIALSAPTVEHRVLSYGEHAQQRVDLYLPAKTVIPLTLVVVNGEHWDADPVKDRLPDSLLRFWSAAGLRVAQVWYRPAPDSVFPAQAEDLAAALARIQEDVAGPASGKQYLCLLGQSSGAHLAALMALAPAYLRTAGVPAKRLAGVIGISGIYDLLPEYSLYESQSETYTRIFGNEAQRRAASPVYLDNPDTPPFLILSAEKDVHGYAVDARRLGSHLLDLGSKGGIRMLVKGADHDALMRLDDRDNPAAHLVLDFLRIQDLEDKYRRLVRMESRWQQPPFSTLPFQDLGLEVQELPMNDKVRSMVKRAFLGQEYRLEEWALTRFRAVDLFELLEHLGTERTGSGDWLQTTNVRGEKLFWKLDEMRPYRPVVVIGLDDEQELFRVTSFYLAKREYSWVEPEGLLPPMARSLGAFIYFLKPPPDKFYPRYQAQFALTLDSFRLLDSDPLQVLRNLDPALRQLVIVDNGCVSCHAFRGVGAKAHHLTAVAAEPHGGYALPLVSYAPDVWKNFIFDQRAVAELIGVSPNVLPDALGKQLYRLVENERP